jgi:hypothetical protein
MSSLEQRLLEFKPRVDVTDDPDFDACIAAREAMTQPCFCITEFYCDRATDFVRSCWGGHILRAMGYSDYSQEWPSSYLGDMNRIAKKLGFSGEWELFNYNDANFHAQVIAEFDRRLQQWGEHG